MPGGNFLGRFEDFVTELKQFYPFAPTDVMARYARAYGTRTHQLLHSVSSLSSMGGHLGAGIYECEVDYLMRHEWAVTVDDILWRRTKRGLHGGAELAKALGLYLQHHSFMLMPKQCGSLGPC